MSDSDVQDVRDMVAKQTAEALAQQKAMLKLKKMTERPGEEEDIQTLMQLKDTFATRHEKETRLGLRPESES